jgi:hypothetical protein
MNGRAVDPQMVQIEAFALEKEVRTYYFPTSEPLGNSPWNADNYVKHFNSSELLSP